MRATLPLALAGSDGGVNVSVNAGPAAQMVVSDDAVPAGVDSDPS